MNRFVSYSILLTLLVIVSACRREEVAPRPTPADGRLNGLFSISADKQVYFSKGNLRCNPKKKIYSFADEQYEVVGKNNNQITKDYDGWIDLFGWGTGRNPASYGLVYLFYDKFYEWGDSAIVNGGNVPRAWRTLSYEEWEYIFFERPHAQAYHGIHTIYCDSINQHKAIILLPDNWTEPAGLSISTDSLSFALGKVQKLIPVADWRKMEKAGAVALPCGGSRLWGNTEGDEIGITAISGVNTSAYYWSSSFGEDKRSAWSIEVVDSLPELAENLRLMGFSVRLVQDK